MVAFILCILIFDVSAAQVDDKIRVEDVVLKHLEAIGTDQARRSGRSRIVADLQFTIFQANNPLALDWTITLTRFTFDHPIEEKEFVVDN